MVTVQLDYMSLTSSVNILNLDIYNLLVINIIPWIYAHTNLKIVCLYIMTTYLINFSLQIWILLLLHYISVKEYENLYTTIHL